MKNPSDLSGGGTGGLLIWLVMAAVGAVLQGCQSQPAAKPEAETDTASTHSITAQVAESLAQVPTNQKQTPAPTPTPTPPPSREAIQKQAQKLPPPKKEPWMDTLTDLTNLPPPNAASLLSEEPIPLNRATVEQLIAVRFQNTKPEELLLRLYVSEAGTVLRYQIIRSSNPQLGPEYFVWPLLEFRFSPAKQRQKPVSTWTTVRLQIPKGI